MDWSFIFFFDSVLLGVGLAMDAFSVSLANGLNEPGMRRRRMSYVAGVYAFFQFLMPLAGWLCVRTVAQTFSAFQKYIPWIALLLLLYIGGKMLIEAIRGSESEQGSGPLTVGVLLLQGIATSIDALSVGFAISEYKFPMAFVSALIIAVVTFLLCFAALRIGKRFGTRLAGRAGILGGCILILIGLEIFIRGVFF